MEESSANEWGEPGQKLNEPAYQSKHAAMLERLAARHSQAAAARRSESTAVASVKSFLDRFSETKRSIESDLALCRSSAGSPNLKSDLEKVTTSIANLEKLLAESSYLLPPYEVRAALKSISDLKEELEKTNAELVPRKKFSFRNKPVKKESNGSTEKVGDAKPEELHAEETSEPHVVQDSPGFRNKECMTLVKEFGNFAEQNGEFSLSDLNSCEIYIRGHFRALFVHRLRNCRVFVGPVLGSVLIEDVEGCLLMLASHQIRIHHARKTDFYLRVRSRPIIEDCSGVRFGPYRLFYERIEEDLKAAGLTEETGNWANVDDFKWLRAMQSPNWSLLPEEEYRETANITTYECGK